MAKPQSSTADALSPFLDQVQSVSVTSLETRTTMEWPASLGINIEATALAGAVYRGDQVVVERLAKFSANGSLAGRFLFGGEISIDAAPTTEDWIQHSGVTLRGAGHSAMAFTNWSGAQFIRSGPRLLQIGYDTYSKDFPTSIEFPGGTRITEDGSLGIGVGVPATALHVSSKGDQVRIEHPGGGFLGIEVGPFGNAQFSTTGGEMTIAGVLNTPTLNAGAVNVSHLHTSTQVLDKTLSLSGVVSMAARAAYVRSEVADVTGAASVSLVVNELMDEAGARVFEDSDDVTVYWVDRAAGVDVEHAMTGTVTFVSRDASVYPGQQTYTFAPTEFDGDASPFEATTIPARAIAKRGEVGYIKMLNGLPAIKLGVLNIARVDGTPKQSSMWSDDGRIVITENDDGGYGVDFGYVSSFPHFSMAGRDTRYRTAATGVQIETVDSDDDGIGDTHTVAFGMSDNRRLYWHLDETADPVNSVLEINATSLQVGGVDVTLSGVVPNTAPAAGQILVGNAGGTAYAPVSMSGDATLASTGALTIANNAVSLGKMAQMATASLLGRSTSGTGNVEVLSAATAKTLLSLNNVENTALSTWAGSSNITTVGTLTGLTTSGKATISATLTDYASAIYVGATWDTPGGGYAVQGVITRTGTQSAAIGVGTLGQAYYAATAGTTQKLVGLYGRTQITGATAAGAISNAWGMWIDAPTRHATATTAVTAGKGIHISNQGGAWITNSYGLYLDAQSGSATKSYAIYSNGGESYHAGDIGIGNPALANTKAYVYKGGTNTGLDHIALRAGADRVENVGASNNNVGVYAAAGASGSANTGTLYGNFTVVGYNGSGTVSAAYGHWIQQGPTSGTITAMSGLTIANQGNAAGAIGTRYGVQIGTLDNIATVTTLHALTIGAQTAAAGTTKYGIFIGNISGASVNNYSIYTSTGAVRFNDRLEVYGSVAASKQLVVRGAAAQSGNLIEWADSAGTAYGAITSAGYFGIGTASPSSAFEMHATTIARIYRYANPGNLQLYRGNGTQASPTQVLTGEAVGQLTFVGYGTGGWPSTASAQIRAVALENFTSTAAGMSVEIRTAPIGSTTAATRATFDTAGLTLPDAHDIVTGTTTGTKVATGTTQKLAFHGAAPVVQRAGAAQAAVGTTAATQTTPWGFSTQAQADGIITLLNELRAALVEKGLIKGAA